MMIHHHRSWSSCSLVNHVRRLIFNGKIPESLWSIISMIIIIQNDDGHDCDQVWYFVFVCSSVFLSSSLSFPVFACQFIVVLCRELLSHIDGDDRLWAGHHHDHLNWIKLTRRRIPKSWFESSKQIVHDRNKTFLVFLLPIVFKHRYNENMDRCQTALSSGVSLNGQ